MTLITDDNDNLVEAIPPENMRHIKSGFYLVRTQAGFRKAFKHFEEDGDINPSEVVGYPRQYPTIVFFSYGYQGFVFIRANCLPLEQLKTLLE